MAGSFLAGLLESAGRFNVVRPTGAQAGGGRGADPNGQVDFSWWLSTSELPAGMKQPPVTIHLLVKGKEIAASCGPVNPTTNDWYFNQHKELSVPTLPRNHWLTLVDITKTNGEVALVVKASGQPIKTYKARVTGGQLQRLPQNA